MTRLEVPADCPFFRGHFPGRPILPGIAYPWLAAEALSAETGAAVWIAEIPALKLRSPVRPGDVLALALNGPAGNGLVRFEFRRGEEPISTGSFRTGSPDGASETELASELPEPSGSFPAIGSLVPHGPPARLIRDVLDASDQALTGLAEIPADSPFVVNGRAPAFLGLEAAAQGAAVLEALGRSGPSGPRIGYLVGVRNARCRIAWLPLDRPFRIALRLTGSAEALSIYDVAVAGTGGEALVAGTISTYVRSGE